MKISILGCGNWGSVFGIIQHKNNHEIKIWEIDCDRAISVNKTRNNDPFLKNYKIPTEIIIDCNLELIIHDADLIVFAVPTQTLRTVIEAIRQIKPRYRYLLSLCKGIDYETLERPSQIINHLPGSQSVTYVLSGPCIANEIIRGAPTAAVLAGENNNGISEIQHQLSSDAFRLYKSNDIIGVEIGAALKNVIAIGCGISDGIGFGINTKGALLTRAFVEMQRLGQKLNAQEKTFLGLAGIGDLITTAFSPESRNYQYGSLIAKSMSDDEIKKKIIMVAEGVPTARAIHRFAQEYSIDMPICEAVYKILYEGRSPTEAIKDLMGRPLKEE